MQIKRIVVENYSNVQDFDVEIGGHAVFVGPNASGKSSILRVLDASLSWSRARLHNEMKVDSLRDQSRPLTFSVVLHDFTDDDLAAFPDEVAVGATPAESQMTVEVSVAISPTDPDDVDISRDIVQPGVQPVAVSTRHLEGFGWRLIEASRNADRDLAPDGTGVLGQLVRATDLGDDQESIDEALKAVDSAIRLAESVVELRSNVAKAFSEVFPSPVHTDDIGVRLSADQDPLRSLNVSIRTAATGEVRPFTEQSDGMRSLAVMSLRLLGRGGDLMTGVDEPESHLDSRSQARIGRLFASSTGQRIIATHAPTVVRQFRPENVIALTHSGVRKLTSNAATTNRKFFSRWWVENMIDPLVSRSVILVEGPSDEILLRRVAHLTGIDLDANGVSVVDIGGANNFPNAIKLFGPAGFDVKLAALVDLTEQSDVASGFDVPVSDLSDHNVVTCDYDLEDEYVQALGPERVAELLALPDAGLGTVDPADVLARCGGKNKVRAALGVAAGLTTEEAEKITPLTELLKLATTF